MKNAKDNGTEAPPAQAPPQVAHITRYRCRACNEIFNGKAVSDPTVAAVSLAQTGRVIGAPDLTPIAGHQCKQGQMGFGDLTSIVTVTQPVEPQPPAKTPKKPRARKAAGKARA